MKDLQANSTDRNIKLLPEHIIDQIKAGEVIERPASIIKELLENSIDANSDRIDIHIVDNGLELISIEDNGTGIQYGDLPIAFCRHATSKIDLFDDLYRLRSFGFRGEALASISSVTKLTCISANEKTPSGKIVIHGGEQKEFSEYHRPQSGTSIYIEDLFYNTPARLKFLKSQTSEKNAIKKIINSFLLSNPHISFSVKWDNKEKAFFPAETEDGLKKRVQKVMFRNNNSEDILEITGEYEGHQIHGLLSRTGSRGNAGKQQYFFVNNRLFFDPQLHQILIHSMNRSWSFGETGNYIVSFSVPPSSLDVNVHPGKTKVKFFKSAIVQSLLSSNIKKLFPADDSNQISINESFHYSEQNFFNGAPLPEGTFTGQAIQQNLSPDSMVVANLNNGFLVLQLEITQNLENPFFICNLNNFIAQYWTSMITRNFPVAEGTTTPLLISEPFKYQRGTIDKYVPFLIQLGFEMDRLDDETVGSI